MAFLSREHAEMRLAALTMGAIVKARMYRMRYLSTKTWCAKAGGNQHDLHKIFGKLTNTMDKNGTPFWRKKDFVTRRDRRSMTYGGGGTMESMGTGTVTGLAMTEKKRGKLNEERRKQRLKGQGESEGRAAESGLRLTVMHMPLGTGRILAEGRLAKVGALLLFRSEQCTAHKDALQSRRSKGASATPPCGRPNWTASTFSWKGEGMLSRFSRPPHPTAGPE